MLHTLTEILHHLDDICILIYCVVMYSPFIPPQATKQFIRAANHIAQDQDASNYSLIALLLITGFLLWLCHHDKRSP
jgi:hypothetical protein